MSFAFPGRRSRPSRLRLSLALLAVVLGAVAFACVGGAGGPPGAVHVLTAKGVVNPVMSRYIDRGIDAAEDADAAAVVIRLDTPGGLLSSMEEIVKRILASDVPVVVYVWPPGGRAASAGTFITMAAHVAAMAPSTRIGAAHPVGGGGEEIEGPLGDKVTNDAVALIRSLASLRGRNADWAEDAVRESVSANDTEALDLNIVEYVAPDLETLLQETDGREVTLREGGPTVVLETAEAPLVYNSRNFIENFLDIIADPNIAFLLISLGSLAIFLELSNPGTIFPGVFGVIALILGFFALSVLPFNWAGVALIVFAFVLFGLEIFVTSGGILGIGGVVSLVLGGLLLTSGNPPGFQVSRPLVLGLGTAMGVLILFVVVNIIRARRMPAQVGVETVVGKEAVARSSLNPRGFVFLEGEYWSAEAEDGPIRQGERVVVTEVHGLKLKVRRASSEITEEASERR